MQGFGAPSQVSALSSEDGRSDSGRKPSRRSHPYKLNTHTHMHARRVLY